MANEGLALEDVTYRGPPLTEEDQALVAQLPDTLHWVLGQLNGFVAFGGALHVRGACQSPTWHSLQHAWGGEQAIHRLFPAVRPTDIPFGQDCIGDQFLLRDAVVMRLDADTGKISSTALELMAFLEKASASPESFLKTQPLDGLRASGQELAPGQVVAVIPPLVIRIEGERSYKAVPAEKQARFRADIARQLAHVPDGAQIRLQMPGEGG